MTYDYAQLEGLWLQAGGPADEAPVAAAIAEAESGGNPLAAYPGTTVAPGQGSTTDATGLWQILGLPAGNFTASELTDPTDNALMAVAKYDQAGDSFAPWQTYDTGGYAQYLQSGVTPASTSDLGTTATQLDSFPGGKLDPLNLPSEAENDISNAFATIWQNFETWAGSAAVVLVGAVLVVWGLGRATGAGRRAELVIENTAGAAGSAAGAGAAMAA